MDIAQKARHYYDKNQHEELKELAESIWPDDPDGDILEGAADVCFFTRNLAWRNRPNPQAGTPAPYAVDPANRDALVEREFWQARAITAAMLTGERHTVARLLLQRVFMLMEYEAYGEAREVLGEMLRLVGPEHELRTVFMRLHEEKVGYSYLAEGLYPEAASFYTSALRFCEGDPRGALKVRGGLVLAQWLELCGNDEDDGEWGALCDGLIAELSAVHEEAIASGFADVAKDAEHNLSALREMNCEDWRPFELL